MTLESTPDDARTFLRHTVATLAYRLVSFWLPIPAGGGAWLVFRRRYP